MIYTDGELLVSDTSLNELHLFANVIGLKKNGSVTNLSARAMKYPSRLCTVTVRSLNNGWAP